MSNLLIGLVGALMATNQPTAISNLVVQTTGVSVRVPDNPAEVELDRLMADDDAALAEIDGWIQENQAFKQKGAGIPDKELNQRINKRLDQVRRAYDGYLKRYTNSASGRIAYASFLDHVGEEEQEVKLLEEAAKLDPRNPAAFNQLANYYGHRGPINLAFEDYEKAISIDPMESVYYWNLATTVYLYRKDSREYYHLTEQQVFDKAMGLYGKALELDPTNFTLATDLAESYYAIKPFRPEAALVAWTNALNIANNEIEREGVYVHLARVKYLAGDFAQARAQLLEVTNKMYAELKRRLTRNMDEKEGKGTNAPVSAPGLVSNGAASSSETNRAAVAPPAGIKP